MPYNYSRQMALLAAAMGTTSDNSPPAPATGYVVVSTADSAAERLAEPGSTPSPPIPIIREPSPPPPPPEKGMLPTAKTLYEAVNSPRILGGSYAIWTDQYPTDLLEPSETEETARHALLVRYKRCQDGEKQLEIDSVVVQSPLLKEILGGVLKGYPGVTTGLQRLEFAAPFQAFFHRWEELERAKAEVDAGPDGPAKEHLALFHTTMHAELAATLAAKEDLIAHKVITFQHLWTLFRTGDILVTTQHGRDVCLKLKTGAYRCTISGTMFRLDCEAVDWDGRRFGRAPVAVAIWSFEGTEDIESLAAYPLAFHRDAEGLRERLVARGRKFEALRGFHYKSYSGLALGKPPRWCEVVRYQIQGRVVVDMGAYVKFNTHDPLTLQGLVERRGQTVTVETGPRRGGRGRDAYYEEEMQGGDIIPEHTVPLSEEQCLIANPMVRGFAMKNKKWVRLFVDSIGEIEWSDRAFESLVLPSTQKELILAFAESQLQSKHTFDDVIAGKGMGIIMLLSGPPGVGKTLTAESVAETMRSPLYALSAGDLGSHPSEIEAQLSTVLEMATKWRAVLLLDEADVFLEQRTPHDLERNKLVSIFLRVLEYYEGILFLTTNRVQTFDQAFQSRVHVSIKYPQLDVGSRRKVWGNFVGGLGGGGKGLTEGELDGLAEMRLNGREIKNVLKTALLLAGKRGEGLKREHVEVVLGVMENLEV